MSGQIIGNNTTLHVFKSRERFERAKKRLSARGKITEIFVNNRYAFELKTFKKI